MSRSNKSRRAIGFAFVPARKNSCRRRCPRRQQFSRRIHDHGRVHPRRQKRRRDCYRSHRQRRRLIHHARQARWQRDHAGPDRSTGQPGAAQPRSDPTTRRQSCCLVRARRNCDRRRNFYCVGAGRSTAPACARPRQCGRRPDHCLSLRSGARHAHVDDGRHGARSIPAS